MFIEESLQAWLRPANHELTDEQFDAFVAAVKQYYELPFRKGQDAQDFLDEDEEALNAILQTLLNEDTLEAVASRSQRAEAQLNAWIRAAAAFDMSEAEIARKTSLHRSTVRARLGK